MADAPKIFVAESRARRGPVRALLILLLLLLAVAGAAFYYFDQSSNSIPEPKSEPAILPAETLQQPASPAATSPPATPAPVIAQAPLEPPLLPELDPHLELFLPFNDNLEDASLHQLKIQAMGNVEATPDGAHFFDDGFLAAPHIAFDGHPFSFALWVMPEGQIDGYGLLQQEAAGERNMHLHVMFREPNRPRIGFYLNDLQAPQAIRSDFWTHLVFQFTGASQEIWLNGVRVAEQKSAPYLGASGATFIGKPPHWNNVLTSTFQGYMRDLRIYDVALDAEQIRTLSADRGFKVPAAGSAAPNPKRVIRNEQF